MRLLLLILCNIFLFSSTTFCQFESEEEFLLSGDPFSNYAPTGQILNNPIETVSLSEEIELLRGTRKDILEFSGWTQADSIQYTYDGQNELERTTLIYDAGEWNSETRWINEYDAEDKLLTKVKQTKGNADWENHSKFNYEYDADNNISALSSQSWDSDIQNWTNRFQRHFEYDTDGLQTVQTSQSWTDNQWKNSVQWLYDYSSNNVKTTTFQGWEDQTMSWEDISKRRNTLGYDNNDNVISSLNEIWENEVWENDSKADYEFNAENEQTLRIQQEWDSGENDWRNYLRETTTFNGSAPFTQSTTILEFWDQEENDWRNDRKTISDLTEGGNISLLVRESWTSEWEVTDRTYYYYDITTNIAALELNPFNLSVSPNPGNGLVNINFTELDTKAAIQLFNVQGQLVYNKTISNSSNNMEVDFSNLPKGSYILQLKTDHQVSNQKILIL